MLFFCSFHSICLARFQSPLWKHFILFEICFLLQPLMADTWPRKSRMKLPTAAKISHNISIFGFINKNIYERTKMSFHPLTALTPNNFRLENFRNWIAIVVLAPYLNLSYQIHISYPYMPVLIWIYVDISISIHKHTISSSCFNVQEADRLHSRSRSSLAFPWVHLGLPILKIQAKLFIKMS